MFSLIKSDTDIVFLNLWEKPSGAKLADKIWSEKGKWVHFDDGEKRFGGIEKAGE